MSKKIAHSQSELKEIYVREGWLLGKNLGRLREWLASQKSASQPDVLVWRKMMEVSRLRAVIANDAVERGWDMVLRDVAEPIEARDQAFRDYVEKLPGFIRWFAERLDSTINPFSIADQDRIAFVDVNGGVVIIHLDLDEDESMVFYVSESDLIDAALNSWTRGGDRAGRAKTTCCAWMQSALNMMENLASKSFDTAVAVSPDGRRIQNVDYVVVYSFDSKKRLGSHVFRQTAFHSRKIRLGALHVVKQPMPNKKRTDDELLDWVQNKLAKKSILEGLALNRGQILIQVGLIQILYIGKDSIPDELRALLASTAPAPAEVDSGTINSPPPDMEQDLRRPAPPPAAHSPTLPSAVDASLLPPVLDPSAARLPPPGGLPST